MADCPSGNAYKISVTGFAFSVIWHENNSADWLAALASPYPASPDFPLFRGQNKSLYAFLQRHGSIAKHPWCPLIEGERWWRQPPKGESPSPAGRLYGFRRQRRYKKWRRRRRTSPAQRYYITPEGESPQPACKAKPITGRTLGAQGQRPGGAINPRPRKRASTFGNTGKHRPGPGPDRATGACTLTPLQACHLSPSLLRWL